MKKVLLLSMLLTATCTFAQDVIVKKDGSTILSKVIEIGTSEVKYKKFTNQKGPTYSIRKSDVRAINYENGEKETFADAVPTPDLQRLQFDKDNYINSYLFSQQNQITKDRLLVSAKHWRTAGSTLGTIFMLGGIGLGLVLGSDDNKTAFWIATGSGIAVGALTAMTCGGIANKKEEEANAIVATNIIKQDFNLGNSRLSTGIDLVNDKMHKEHALGLGLSVNF